MGYSHPIDTINEFVQVADKFIRGMTRMLYSMMLKKLKKAYQSLHLLVLILFALLSLSSCLPTGTRTSLDVGNSTENPDSSETSNYTEPTFPLNDIFLQEGATLTNSNLSLPINFSDSFLIRGNALSIYLRGLPPSLSYCLVGKYNISGIEKFLVMSAKSKSYVDLRNKTKEFYLQVEPNLSSANQNDCSGYNLTTTILQQPSTQSLSFSLTDLCSNCSSTVSSSGLKLYFGSGQEVTNVKVSSLLLTIGGTNISTSNSCSESTSCRARGFDCCLNGQCIKEGVEKPGVTGLPGFSAAKEDVELNPSRFILYPQFYFVCENRPESGSSTSTSGTVDPSYESSVRLMELRQLYDCLNQVNGEFSYCTLKYTQANNLIPGVFSPETQGFYDDINFSNLNPAFNTGDKKNNIVKIIYGGQTLYEEEKTPLTSGTFGPSNDDIISSQAVTLTASLPLNAKDANLYITYRVDGTCEKVNSSLTRCTKTYIFDSSDTSSSYWHDSSKIFKLPSYADTTSSGNIIVRLGGSIVPEDSTTWSKSTPQNGVVFANSYPLYKNQVIEITYYVKVNAQNLLSLKSLAQNRINTMCTCGAQGKCNLKPILDSSSGNVVNYECSYTSTNTNEPPVNQTVFVSNKHIANRYFDLNGINYDEGYESALDQELTPGASQNFSYINNNLLKPNNVNQYIGLSEIYGTFSKSGIYFSRPAKMVRVKKDQTYDITVNSGAFSSCVTCGNDYYGSLQKIFPQNFSGQGGGYSPDIYQSSRQNNSSIYRSDDLLFGRACFLPVTMIPWTHVNEATPTIQRRKRLAAQHFLFANGYNRDWFGFDYGSLIGSFDGVRWFSIGNQRRVKATSNKMFIAVNTYLGDLSVDSNFSVNVTEANSFSSTIPDHDTETAGAECQKQHYCSNDNDCFRQLGYDYTCQNVASLTTPWPQFDGNSNEMSGQSIRSLLSLVGGANGRPKRCIYRGRGAPCLRNLDLAATSTTNFNGSSLVGTLMCSHNNSCLSLNTSNRFNDRIARFAGTPASQNAAQASSTTSDLVGLGARIILRPFDYYGTKSTPTTAKEVLQNNNVDAICVPGRDIANASDTFDLNSRHPANRVNSSDKLFGTGPTSSSLMSTKLLNACPATDITGTSLQIYDLDINDPVLSNFTITQNLSSNLLDLSPLLNLNIYSSLNGSMITNVGYQKNTCLRAPGAACFSDMECAPSSFISNKVKLANLSSLLNSAEINFWKEDLVCGNPDFKRLSGGVLNPQFDNKKNKCCREFGKTISVYTQKDSSDFEWCDNSSSTIRVAGINKNLNSLNRYSRVHSVYDKMTCNRNDINSTKTFALSLVANTPQDRLTQILGQYKTLDTLNQRTCCTNHWVRSFSTENGGGHSFSKNKMQNIDKFMFRNISWEADDTNSVSPDPDSAFECDPNNFLNASCEIKSLTSDEEDKYLSWAATLELIGIPQVAIKTSDQIYKLVDDNQNSIAAEHPLTDSDGQRILLPPVTPFGDFSDFIDSDGKRYYSAANYAQMNMPANSLKKVFSESEFNCCVPSGIAIPDTTTSSQCCTGMAQGSGNGRRCCLPNYTDVTVYLNRYVSSEGRGLPDSAYDPATGFIKESSQVDMIAFQKSLCCSGRTMTGVAISQLPIPLTGGTFNTNASAQVRRFNYRDDDVDNNSASGSVGSLFDAGVRWNNHVYCVP